LKRIVKYAAIAFVVVGIILSAGIYYASQKISSEDIKKWTVEGIEKAMPNSKVSLGKVTLSPGLKFSLELIDFKMELKKQGQFPRKDLIHLARAFVKIPIWSVITGRGSISMNVDKPDLYASERSSLMNWVHAMGEKTAEQKETTPSKAEKEDKSSGDSMEDIMRGNSLNLVLTNTSINYDLGKANNGKFVLSKFIIKNLSFKNATAFEIASTLKTKMQPKGDLSLELLSVGQVDLSNYFSKKKLTGLMNVEIKKIHAPQLKKKIDRVKTDMNFEMNGDNLTGSFKATADSFLTMESTFKQSPKLLELSKIKGSVDASDLMNYMEMPEGVNMSSGSVTFAGSMAKRGENLQPDLTFKSIKDFQLKLASGDKVVSNFDGTYKKFILGLNSKSKAFNGDIEAKVGLTFNPNKPFNMADIGPVRSLVWVRNINLKESYIQKTLYGKKEEAKSKGQGGASAPAAKASKNPPINLPMINAVVKWDEVKLGKENFTGAFRWKGKGKTLICKGCNFQFSKGKGSFDHNINLADSNDIKISFKSILNNLNMSSLKPFLPPALSKFNGNLRGDVLGKTSSKGNYDVQVKVVASDGEIQGNKIGGYIKDLVGNVPILSKSLDSRKMNVSDRFKKISFTGNLKNTHYDLKSFKYIGHSEEKDVSINGSGNLYPLNKSKRGIVDMNIVDKSEKLIKNLKRNIGSDTLPMRLRGYGLDLKPDYGYTIKKISKGAVKTQGKKHLKKAVDKLLKKDKLKKVFKGLFK